MHDSIVRMQGKMGSDSLPKMDGAHQKILTEVLGNACDLCTFKLVFARQQAIIGRNQVNIKITIDEPANVMQNMRRGALRAGHNVKSSVEYSRHTKIIYERPTCLRKAEIARSLVYTRFIK